MKKLLYYGLLVIFASQITACSYTHLVSEKGEYYAIEELKDEKKAVSETVAPYKSQLDAEMNTVIGKNASLLSKEQPESSLGNWCADAVMAQTQKYTGLNIDFAVLNYGGLRIPSLPQGEITKGKIFELMPFDNMLVAIEMKGSELGQLFEHIAQKGGWPVSSAIRMEFDDEFAVHNLTIEGEKIDPNKSYQIATIDYLANGGDKCSFFKDKKRTETGQFMRTAVIEYVEELTKKGKEITAKKEGRIVKRK
jgi:2',3'-cyclic-nucleotide 2'-phosphodiesterase (5'-nucleotidase family)